jgi:hypothetical protein
MQAAIGTLALSDRLIVQEGGNVAGPQPIKRRIPK